VGTPLELVERAWDIPAINARYADFLERFQAEPEARSDEDAFRAYVTVLHEYRKFLFTDPGLPLALQPEGFLGLEAATLFRSRKASLSLHVDRFVSRTFKGLPTLEVVS
jgi:phenylacetic acid degradation operon negative regulatory protein